MKRICVLTTYCERPRLMTRVIDELSREARSARGIHVTHIILDDGSKESESIEKVDTSLYESKKYKIFMFRQDENLGRIGYRQTVSNLMLLSKDVDYDYALFNPDDFLPCKGYFSKLLKIYKSLPKPCALNDFHRSNSRVPERTFALPRFDGAFIIEKSMLEAIDYTVPLSASELAKKRTHGSFAWQMMCDDLFEKIPEFRVFTTNCSLRHHIGEESKMNPDRPFSLDCSHWIEDQVEPNLGVINPQKGREGFGNKDASYEKSLFIVGDGLGNQIQTWPAYALIQRKYPYLDVLYPNRPVDNADTTEFYRIITEYFGNELYIGQDELNIEEYVNKFNCSSKYTHHMNEVDANMLYANKIRHQDTSCDPKVAFRGITPLDWPEVRGGQIKQPMYDVIISNGSRNDFRWIKKRYNRWDEVVQMLLDDGFTVASVGLPDEWIPGTEDQTGVSISDTFDLISVSRILAANDSGMYHFANAIGKRNVVLFTATNIKKNYNPIFHRFSTVIKPPTKCAPCQGVKEDLWKLTGEWRSCLDWKCTYETEPVIVYKGITQCLKNKKTT